MTRNVDPFALLAEVLAAREAPWRQKAACRGLPTEWFYPEQGGPTGEALNVCRQCPVKEACAADGALETFGIWGGQSNKHRKEIRNGRPGPQPIKHGTAGGYLAHRRRGETACPACLAAHAAAKQARVNPDADPYEKPPIMNHPEMIGPRRRWHIPEDAA